MKNKLKEKIYTSNKKYQNSRKNIKDFRKLIFRPITISHTYSKWQSLYSLPMIDSSDDCLCDRACGKSYLTVVYWIQRHQIICERQWPDPLNSSTVVQSISSSFSNVQENGAKQLINLIYNSDVFCEVKSTKRDVVIPKGTTTQAHCRANTSSVTTAMPLLFEPDEQSK